MTSDRVVLLTAVSRLWVPCSIPLCGRFATFFYAADSEATWCDGHADAYLRDPTHRAQMEQVGHATLVREMERMLKVSVVR